MDIAALEEALDMLVLEILALCQSPGISIAVGIGDEIALARGFGLADVEQARPMTADTVGPTGSDGKPYTAVAAMQLVERGLIGIDDPVDEYLHGFAVVN